MNKEQYIETIIDLMKNTDDMVLLDFVYQLLDKAA